MNRSDLRSDAFICILCITANVENRSPQRETAQFTKGMYEGYEATSSGRPQDEPEEPRGLGACMIVGGERRTASGKSVRGELEENRSEKLSEARVAKLRVVQ